MVVLGPRRLLWHFCSRKEEGTVTCTAVASTMRPSSSSGDSGRERSFHSDKSPGRELAAGFSPPLGSLQTHTRRQGGWGPGPLRTVTVSSEVPPGSGMGAPVIPVNCHDLHMCPYTHTHTHTYKHVCWGCWVFCFLFCFISGQGLTM